MVKIAINGLGRIGRLLVRSVIEGQYSDKFEIVYLNSPSDNEVISHLIKYDSVHSRANFKVNYNEENIIIAGKEIPVTHKKNIKELDLNKYEVDILFDCSGKNLKLSDRENLQSLNVKKIILSAPSENADKTIIYGVNHSSITNGDKIISSGSCTTNAIAPIIKVLSDNFRIESAFATTIHAYTSDQNLHDNSHNDLRRARAASLSMIPTKTGAAKSLIEIFPELYGKFGAAAIRVPTPNVSIVDLTSILDQKITREKIDDLMYNASRSYLKNILGVAEAKLVSCDFNHTEFSSIYDPYETSVLNDNLIRILSWYDNEFAFVQRMIDIANLMDS